MITLYDHIQELRAELRGCRFTRRDAPPCRPSWPRPSPSKPSSTALDRALEAHFEKRGRCERPPQSSQRQAGWQAGPPRIASMSAARANGAIRSSSAATERATR